MASTTHPPRRPLTLAALTLVLLGHTLGGVLYASARNVPDNQALTLGLIQGNVPTREKLTPQGVNQALAGYTDGYRSLVAQGVDAVVTPEGALPQLWNPNSPQGAAIIRTVEQAGVPLWLGTFAPVLGEGRFAKRSLQESQYTQSLLEIRPDGAIHISGCR